VSASLWAARGAATRVALSGLAKSEAWRPAALAAFRDGQLRRLLRHAHRRGPFHRIRLDESGFSASEPHGVRDLAHLPIMTKRDIQRSAEHDLIAEGCDPAGLIERRTTGSTGQPLCIRRTWFEERILGALRWRALRSMGARSTHRFAEIEEPLPDDPSDRGELHGLLQRLGLYRQLRVDALRTPAEILQQLDAFAPDVISGYAGVVARIARAVPAPGQALSPQLVAIHSDTLTPQMRGAISSGFQAPVFEIYDCNECNVVAWECRETGALHTCDDSTIVEVLRPDGTPAEPGEAGEIVVTALHSFAMPFIRYRIGDVVVAGEPQCACGSAFGTLGAVQGRMFDYFPLADGRTLHPYELINVLGADAPWITEYRLLQERSDLVRLRYASDAKPSADQLRTLEGGLRACLGPRVALSLEAVEYFEAEGSAKLRVCRSLVASEYDGA
jgi:phenylacetate-CoA ligase